MKASTITVREMFRKISNGMVGNTWTNYSIENHRNLCFVGGIECAKDLQAELQANGYDNVVRFFPAFGLTDLGYVRVLRCKYGV